MIRLIAAIDRKRGLAKRGILPWYIPEDEQYYDDSTKTRGGNVLIGSTTFKTIGEKPMPSRQNYLLTRDKTPKDGVELVNDLDKFLQGFEDKDLWVIGGANVFAQVVQAGGADELYLTHIEADFNCNQFFPEYQQNFKLIEKSDLREQNGFIFSYAKYIKT